MREALTGVITGAAATLGLAAIVRSGQIGRESGRRGC